MALEMVFIQRSFFFTILHQIRANMPSVCSKVVKSTGATPNFSKFRVKFPDVAIHCENGTKIIKASSIVLAEVSPFFASLLSFQSGEVKFSELTLSEVEKLLDFLYDGSVSFDTQHSFDQFVANARKLQIRRLPNFEIRGSGVAPEALSAEASSGGSSPPAKRIKIEHQTTYSKPERPLGLEGTMISNYN